MDTRRWALSTSGECDFVLEPPKRATPPDTQIQCLGLEKIIQEERDNHEWNIAFQKAMVKRLEASERRITLDDYLDDDDGGRSGPGPRKKKRKRRKDSTVSTDRIPVSSEKVEASLPPAQEVFKDIECKCTKKIKQDEKKRKRFVKALEKEQERFALKNLRAQHKYERARMKAYKKCEDTQLAIEKGFLKGPRGGADKAEETFSVFIHMDPAACNCRGRAACCVKFKNCFFKCCFWFYLIGFIVCSITGYFLLKV